VRGASAVVVAAGNSGFDLDHNGDDFTVLCDVPGVICVSASGPTDSGSELLGPFVDIDAPAFYTNYGSRKAHQLDARPRACLVFQWSELERQVRIEGEVEKVSAAESDAYFASRPLGARLSAWASAQSASVASRKVLEDAMEEARQRHGDTPPRPPHWGGYRVIPRRLEFWQGRADRLHDRLLYTASGAGWKIERLAP
jgi:pyridoxamine 5'-phosphate oxidase